MENNYRNNIIDFATIYLGKSTEESLTNKDDFDDTNFIYFIYKELFGIDINKPGYGLDNSTKQMTNDIGDLKIYKENDPKKTNYLTDIKKGDLVFFHTKSLNEKTPAPDNHYPGHTGIYLGDKKFIHASPTQEKIVIDTLDDQWLDILVASRDIIKNSK